MAFAKKSLGQNFLMHAQTAERIVEAAKLPEHATVLEVGPGTGMLTRALLTTASKVIAVEADDALAPELEGTFADEVRDGKLLVVHGDIRAFDTGSIDEPYQVVANIPYYITGEIIRQFLSSAHKPESMTLLVQKEVAERIARNEGKESLLSLSITAYGTPEYCFTVPRGAFVPSPSVDSAVLAIRAIKKDAFPSVEAEAWFFSILRTAFAHKRKRLAKNLEELVPKERIAAAMRDLGLNENARSEEIPVATWKALAAALA